MVLRFQHLPAACDIVQHQINRACRDICGDSLEKYAALRRQFYITKDCDLYIDDDMPDIESGYIMKVLRARGFLEENAEVVVPCRYHSEVPSPEDTSEPAPPDVIVSIEDYLPLSAFDDGNFEAEYEEILNMSDDDDE